MSVARICCSATRGIAPRGRHAMIALDVRAEAKAAGFTFQKITASHQIASPSRYVHLEDPKRRAWLVRVSNHNWGGQLATSIPNLDLISGDGAVSDSAWEALRDWLRRAIAGEIDWRNPHKFTRQRDRRRR